VNEAIDYLKSQRGKQFDRLCVDAFVGDTAKVEAIRADFTD
jgi:response regulator RpfG family c-di-GMP phosphodiesterase